MTTANPTDPAEVRLTGENSFIRLPQGNDQTTRPSHWRVLLSPVGPGHVLFLKSELVDGIRIERMRDFPASSRLYPDSSERPERVATPVLDEAEIYRYLLGKGSLAADGIVVAWGDEQRR